MGATRFASGIFSAASSRGKRCSYYLVEFVFSPLINPDARRVAPISACVSSSDKRYHKTQALMGATFVQVVPFVIAKQSRKFAVRLYFVGAQVCKLSALM